ETSLSTAMGNFFQKNLGDSDSRDGSLARTCADCDEEPILALPSPGPSAASLPVQSAHSFRRGLPCRLAIRRRRRSSWYRLDPPVRPRQPNRKAASNRDQVSPG